MEEISKSKFKPHALEIMRRVQETGQGIIITDHGRPVLELRPYSSCGVSDTPADYLKGSVIDYLSPEDPVVEDWDANE
jgi:prevent-host-death family protein